MVRKNTLTRHDLFHAILQSTEDNTLFQSRRERDILEGMLKNCPSLKKLKFSV